MKLTIAAFLVLYTCTASACPFCNSKTAAQIRSSLFGPGFFVNLFVTLLPFVIFSVIVFLIYNGGWKRKHATKSTT